MSFLFIVAPGLSLGGFTAQVNCDFQGCIQ